MLLCTALGCTRFSFAAAFSIAGGFVDYTCFVYTLSISKKLNLYDDFLFVAPTSRGIYLREASSCARSTEVRLWIN